MFATACSVSSDALAVQPNGSAVAATDRASLALSDRQWCAAPGQGTESGLNESATAEFSGRLVAGIAPIYRVTASIDPETGSVDGRVLASLPADDQAGATRFFRIFAGMQAFSSGLDVADVLVDGEPVDFELDQALLRVPATNGAVTVELDFRYRIEQMAANESILGSLTGDTLQPDQVGLLGRTETGMQLGHWFPVWLPAGTRTDPDPSGFGDIGAFPTSSICAELDVPGGYSVITSGSDMGSSATTTVQGAMALRDFAVLISNDLDVVQSRVDGVNVRVWGPRDDPEALTTVLDYAVISQRSLSNAFGTYPWNEIDIVSAPLGGGVGGMEWPGMVWIERSMFAGGLPGFGDLGGFGDLFDGEELGGLGDLFGDLDLGDLLGDSGLGDLLGGEALSTTLEWTIAHELGHEWFHAIVGNDSIESPAVDEPLAQFAACIAMQDIHPDSWRDICEAQTIDQFGQYLGLGIEDAVAEQPSDAFDSSLQYGAVIYAKAPGFYLAAGDLLGWDNLTEALAGFVADNRFELVSTNELRDHLVDAAGNDGDEIAALWDRWFREAKGAEDIEASDALGGPGDLGLDGLGLDDIDLFDDVEGLEDLLNSFDLNSFDEGDVSGLSELFDDLLNGD